MHGDLEQGPAHVEDDRAVAVPCRLAGSGGLSEPPRLPRGFVDVPADDVGDRLDEPGRRHREARERRPSPDRRRVDRVPTLVEQLEEIAQPTRLVRREDPRRPSPPSTGRVALDTAIDRERDRDRRPVRSREDVVPDAEAGRVGPERREEGIVERAQPLDGDPRVQAPGRGAARVPVIPGLGGRRSDHLPPCLEDRPEHRFERALRQPDRDRARLDRRAESPPAPGGRSDELAIRTPRAAVAVDRAPDRVQGLEMAPPLGRILEPGEPFEDGQPVDRLLADADRGRSPPVAAEDGPAQAPDRGVVVDAAGGLVRPGPRRDGLPFVEPLETVADRDDRPPLERAGLRLECPGDERIERAPQRVEPPGERPRGPAFGLDRCSARPCHDQIAEDAHGFRPGRLERLERRRSGPTHPASPPARRSPRARAGSPDPRGRTR